MKPPSPYYLSFASIGAISLESRLDCWAKIKYRLEEDELEQRLLEIVRALDIDGVSSIATEKKSSGDYCLAILFRISSSVIIFQDKQTAGKTRVIFCLMW